MGLPRALILLLVGVCSAQLNKPQLPTSPANSSPNLKLNLSLSMTGILPPLPSAVEQVRAHGVAY